MTPSLSVGRGYETGRPPRSGQRVSQDHQENALALLQADLTVLDILAIDDSASSFKVFFSLELQWRDLNLDYCNLHSDNSLNIIRKVKTSE